MALTAAAPRPRGLLRSLVSESAIYGLGGIAAQAVYVILVPIYADVLGPSGTGIAATVTTTLSLSLMLVSLSLPQAFLRWYLKVSETDRQRANVLHTTLALRLLASVAGSLLIAALIVPLTLLLYGDFSYTGVYLVIPAILLFDSILSMPLTFLRAQRRPRAYAALSFGRAFLGSSDHRRPGAVRRGRDGRRHRQRDRRRGRGGRGPVDPAARPAPHSPLGRRSACARCSDSAFRSSPPPWPGGP